MTNFTEVEKQRRERTAMEENPDLISSLPYEILQHILSKVSFKQAVQSSALSTSWRNLISPSLANFETQEQLRQEIESMAESGVNFQTLKLHLRTPSDGAAFAACTKGVNGELHLAFSDLEPPSVNFALTFKQPLSLSRSSFSGIRTLHLRSIPHLAGETVGDLCSSLSSLESLKIEKCGGLERVEVEPSCRNLKNFEVVDCSDIVRVLVSAHSLESFSYEGVFSLVQFVDVPNLVSVDLDFGGGLGRNGYDCEDFLSLLSSLIDIETLRLSTCFIEALCCAGVIFSKLDFELRRLKNLKLIASSKISSKTRDSVACFLHMTPFLEELELKIERNSSSVEVPFSYQNWHEPHLWKDYATVKNEACRLKCVKKIKIYGFTMDKDELLWMDLLLHNAVNLKEMIVDDSWRVVRVPYSHLHYLKLKYLLIPCSQIDSHFVLIAIQFEF